ncbi:MAG: hypothetical protein H3C34_22440 [Caldilineaceae bacterium]|nr:hypothetical protein [Caldilineaceae bacterium]
MERAIAAQPLQADESLAGWVVVLRDVTGARHHLEWQVRQERLATAGQLAAGIAHDFNNILTQSCYMPSWVSSLRRVIAGWRQRRRFLLFLGEAGLLAWKPSHWRSG